jgi:hypothetical protein
MTGLPNLACRAHGRFFCWRGQLRACRNRGAQHCRPRAAAPLLAGRMRRGQAVADHDPAEIVSQAGKDETMTGTNRERRTPSVANPVATLALAAEKQGSSRRDAGRVTGFSVRTAAYSRSAPFDRASRRVAVGTSLDLAARRASTDDAPRLSPRPSGDDQAKVNRRGVPPVFERRSTALVWQCAFDPSREFSKFGNSMRPDRAGPRRLALAQGMSGRQTDRQHRRRHFHLFLTQACMQSSTGREAIEH